MGSKKIKVTVNTNTNTHKSVFWVLCCETLLLLTWTLPNQLHPNTDLGPCIFKRNNNSHSLIICCKCFSTHSQMDLLIWDTFYFRLARWKTTQLQDFRLNVMHHSVPPFTVRLFLTLPSFLSILSALSLSLCCAVTFSSHLFSFFLQETEVKVEFFTQSNMW